MLHGSLFAINSLHLKKCLLYSAIYIFVEFRCLKQWEFWSSKLLLTIPLNEMLMVTLATILSVQMDVSFTVENWSSLIFFRLGQIQLKFSQSFWAKRFQKHKMFSWKNVRNYQNARCFFPQFFWFMTKFQKDGNTERKSMNAKPVNV